MNLYVITSNDYPDAVMSDLTMANAMVKRLNAREETIANTKPQTRSRIYYRVHALVLDNPPKEVGSL